MTDKTVLAPKYDCVGLGICGVDYLCLLPYYPVLDEKIEMVDFSIQGGGPVPTALATITRLGATSAFIGLVGADPDGQFIIDELNAFGVNTGMVQVDRNTMTPKSIIWIDHETGKRTIALNRKQVKKMIPEELAVDQVLLGQILLIDGREVDACLAVARCARWGNRIVVYDAGHVRASRNEELLAVADYPVVSENFAREFFPGLTLERAAAELLKFGARAAVITHGSGGACCAVANDVFNIPSFSVSVVDTTGAGDVFHGAFVFGLIKNWPLHRIITFANATAAIKCTTIGGRRGIPSYDQVEQFIEGLKKE